MRFTYAAAFALRQNQDIAAEQSTMAYRAPELFDVKTGTMLDEKVDIWVSTYHHRNHPFSQLMFYSPSVVSSSPWLTLTLPSRTHKRQNKAGPSLWLSSMHNISTREGAKGGIQMG